jgi:hypothetical protein
MRNERLVEIAEGIQKRIPRGKKATCGGCYVTMGTNNDGSPYGAGHEAVVRGCRKTDKCFLTGGKIEAEHILKYGNKTTPGVK